MKKGKIVVVSTICGTTIGVVTGMIGMGKLIGSRLYNTPDTSKKYLDLFKMMNQWVKIKQNNKNLSAYFLERGYKDIAIYGMNHAGVTLLDELKGTDVQVIYGIDKNADTVYADVNIVKPDADLEAVDAIVVTAITSFAEIKEGLNGRVDCPVISLNDVICES